MTADTDDPRNLLRLRDQVDEAVETALIRRLSVADAMAHVLEISVAALGASAGFIHTYDETLGLRVYAHPGEGGLPDLPRLLAATERAQPEAVWVERAGSVTVAQALDVAGEWFGAAGFVFDAAALPGSRAFLGEALHIVSEEIDGFLYSVRAAREKHRLMIDLGEALRDRVLAEGLRRAVGVLARAIPLDRLLLVWSSEDRGARPQLQLFQGPSLVEDTTGVLPAAPHHAELRALARRHLESGDPSLVSRFDFQGAREEVLINGITQAVVVGKLLATSRQGEFNTYDRELLAAFSEFIRQRIVDFGKEWRNLASAFREEDVARLLQSEDYVAQHLAPREREVAILYSDISGFTALSEAVLRTPSAVAALVEVWSREAVDLVWKHQGVFDKMVGDCVIALFGPPFFERSPEACLIDAIECARAIRDATARLPERAGFEHLRASGLAVSTGVHLAPLFVGRFGPNHAFTGFSSGMNNTARLQGCAGRGEVLVMESAIQRLPAGHSFEFGEPRSAKVKNVAEPLGFRSLR